MTESVGTKRCTACGVEKPIGEFYNMKRSHCKDCERKAARVRMRKTNATLQGKAKNAVRTSRRAVKKVEKERGLKIYDNLSSTDVEKIFSQTKCSYCGKEILERERQLDHVTSLRYGGTNTAGNCTMACGRCNREKSDTPLMVLLIRGMDGMVDYYYPATMMMGLAKRREQDFEQVFQDLTDDTQRYFRIKTMDLIDRAELKGAKKRTPRKGR